LADGVASSSDDDDDDGENIRTTKSSHLRKCPLCNIEVNSENE